MRLAAGPSADTRGPPIGTHLWAVLPHPRSGGAIGTLDGVSGAVQCVIWRYWKSVQNKYSLSRSEHFVVPASATTIR